MTRNVIEISHLSKNFGKIRVLDDISFSVPKGAVFGYLGPNGAGKTTTIKALLGFLRSEGKITLFGMPGNTNGILRKIGYVPDAELPKRVTVSRFLKLRASMMKLHDGKNRINEVLGLVGMKALGNRKMGNLSKGQRQRVALANAILHDPELLILDEPNSGLDPVQRMRVLSLLEDLVKEQDKTVFLSSHIIGEVDRISTHLAIIKNGKLIETGKKADFKSHGLNKGLYVVRGDLDLSGTKQLEYVESYEYNPLKDQYLFRVTDYQRDLLKDLVTKTKSKIRYFSESDLSLEQLFLDKMNESDGVGS